PALFNTIKSDLHQNFGTFMAETGLGQISPCQRFTLSFAHLSAKDALQLASRSISIDRRGQGHEAERREADPARLVQLVDTTLQRYSQLAGEPKMAANSNIANVLLKAIVNTNLDADNIILVFSDMIENSRLNFYRHIPAGNEEVSEAIGKIIDPDVLIEFKRKLEQGEIRVRVVVVLKPSTTGKPGLREVKAFWIAFFKQLRLQNQVQFIDNLTNSVSL
ncbi:MAG: hypothetical protein ACREHG_02555, partial [Candidatus Saccharimonadales bacterium]